MSESESEQNDSAPAFAAPHQVANDRRKENRKLLHTHVILTLQDGTQLDEYSLDISDSGMCVSSQLNLHPGDTCSVFMRLVLQYGVAEFSARAKINYSVLAREAGGFKIGLNFLSLSQAAEDTLRHYLRD
nr:PilZ domain-containing protein [Curvibacter sp. CHRR-16]